MAQRSQAAEILPVDRRHRDPTRQLESVLAALESRVRQSAVWVKFGFAAVAIALLFQFFG